MATIKLTDQQRNAVESSGSCLVSAAAGSGKTAVLTQKVIKLITDEASPCEADRLLVVTFTNAAAAEMRTRIEAALNAECEKQPQNKRLLRQKVLLGNSSVCTIDAFCIDLVKENFYDLGVDPDFSIVNSGVFEGWKNKEVTRIMSEAYAADPENYKAVLDSIGSVFGDDKVKESIIKTYNFSRALRSPKAWLEKSAAAYEDVTAPMESLWGRWVAQNSAEMLGDYAEFIENAVAKVRGFIAGDEMPELAVTFLETFQLNLQLVNKLLGYIAQGAWDDVYFGIQSFGNISLRGFAAMLKGEGNLVSSAYIIKSVQEYTKDIVAKLSELYYDVAEKVLKDIEGDAITVRFIADAAVKLEAALEEKCRESGAFTFDMVEHMALRLLESEAGTEIARRYEWVLVDEYQDVNELQGAIFGLLSRGEERLFAVGDVKQSIYGFRQADPGMFLKKKDSYCEYDGEHYPAKVVLDANFRSRGGVCDFVNFCFGRLMSRRVCDMDYLGEDSLVARADFCDREEADTEVYAVNTEQYENCAEAVAEYINSAIENGMTVGPKGKERTVKYSDFAVLMRSPATHIADYIDAFNRAGIPVNAEKEGFWDSREIMTVCSALKAVNNPCDDISLLSVLMSCPDGFSADDAAQLRIALKDKEAPLYIALCELAKMGHSKAAAILDTLEKLRNLAACSSVSAVLDEVLKWLDIFNAVKFRDNPRGRQGNLLRLVSLAEEFQKGENGDLHSFCGFIRHNAEKSDISSASAPSGENAVRIMSIHKSKGLQFPVCIVTQCDAPMNFLDAGGAVILHEGLGIAVDKVDLVQCVRNKSLAKRVVSAAIKNKTVAEELRLLYVAMTRAEDRLVFFTGSSKPEENIQDIILNVAFDDPDDRIKPFNIRKSPTYGKWLYMCLYNHPSLHEEMARYAPWLKEKADIAASDVKFGIMDCPREKTEQAAEISVAEPDEQLISQIAQRVNYAYPYSDLLDIAAKTSVTALSKTESETADFSETPSFLSGTMLTPAQRGTALHKFMQFCDFGRCERDIEAEADRLEDMEYITLTEREALDISALKKLFASDFYAKIARAEEIKREQRFLSKLPVGDILPELGLKYPEESVVIQGAADCLLIEADGITVIDFKSDRVKDEGELVARYAAQLDIYGKVFSSIYGLPVKEKIIYSFKLGRPVRV